MRCGLLVAGRKACPKRTDLFKAGTVPHLNGDRPLLHHFHQSIHCCILFQSGSKGTAANLYNHIPDNELQSLAAAQRLRADDFTVFKGNVLAVPCQIFALYNTVADCDVFGMPESILGIEDAVFKKGIRKKPAASNRRLCATMAGRQKARDCCGCLKDGQAYFLTPSCTAGAKAPCRHFSKRKRPPL